MTGGSSVFVMGATNFETTATGKTAREAFLNAVNEAHYWHGHGGYTGTIAEKPGFIEFAVPLAELPERKRPVEHYEATKGKVVVMEAECATTRLANAIYDYRFESDDEISVPSWVKPEKAEEYIKGRTEHRENTKADIDFFIAKMGMSKWKQMCEVYDDKWGEAVAIKTGEEEWLFCGMASC